MTSKHKQAYRENINNHGTQTELRFLKHGEQHKHGTARHANISNHGKQTEACMARKHSHKHGEQANTSMSSKNVGMLSKHNHGRRPNTSMKKQAWRANVRYRISQHFIKQARHRISIPSCEQVWRILIVSRIASHSIKQAKQGTNIKHGVYTSHQPARHQADISSNNTSVFHQARHHA